MSQENNFIIKNAPLSIEEVYNESLDQNSGAVNLFVGTVRNENNSKKVAKLVYESYDSMVLAEFDKIARNAKSKWSVNKIVIHHRKGVLHPGDIAVIIAVSSPHRQESFEACSFVIESLKKSAPIWKKEIYDDGQEWLESHP
ncbi:MAG TPA: molybdenum cofactor biosynthesis protein MoaE [Cyclobacteriaceae bacterium]|jgi:molybdopterin synthase catalytic subunit